MRLVLSAVVSLGALIPGGNPFENRAYNWEVWELKCGRLLKRALPKPLFSEERQCIKRRRSVNRVFQ